MTDGVRARLSHALDDVRCALLDNSVDRAISALEHARHWALAAGVPWAGDLSVMIDELDPALRTFRDVGERFFVLFPEDDQPEEASNDVGL
jgi:hypothetical protein